jgi:hypothetical protein
VIAFGVTQSSVDLAAELRLGVDVDREGAKHDALDLDAAGIRPERLRPDEQDDLAAGPRERSRDQCADTPGPKTAWRTISEPDAGHVGVLASTLGLKAEALLGCTSSKPVGPG